MALHISKHTTGSSNISGSMVNMALFLGYVTYGLTGSGSPLNAIVVCNGNDAAYSPILKSDNSEQF